MHDLTFSKRLSFLSGSSIFLICFGFSLAGLSQAVRVDPGFAPILQDFGNTSNRPSAKVSALQSDGKILVGGSFTLAGGFARSGIVRLNADGTTDPTFDAGDIGTAQDILTVTTGGTIYALRLQTDGKILIGGNYKRGNETVSRSLERLDSNGSVDGTFNSAISGDFTTVFDIELQTDGKIIVGGSFQIAAVNPANGQSVTFKNLARLNPDGSFDFSFVANAPDNSGEIVIQPDGKLVVGNKSLTAVPNQLIRYHTNGSVDAVLAEFDDLILGLELLSDGKFIVTGSFNFVNDTFSRQVARLNANGTLDASFTSGAGFMSGLYVEDVAVQPDGKLVIGGDFQIFNNATRWRVARLNQDGSIDSGFNTSTPIAGNVADVLVLPDGKIFFGGAFPRPPANEFYSNIGRLNADGSIDASFNHAYVIFEGEGYTILQQPDGKVLVGGFFFYADNLRRRGIVRYNADGSIDTGFVPFQNIGSVQDIALQADGKILVVSSDAPSALYRLNTDGSHDTSFDDPFVPFSASIQQNTRITTVVVQPDGKILVAGQLITGSATSPSLSGLVRLNTNGSRDTSFQLVGAQGGVKDVYDIVLQPDGKIVIGGDFSHINTNFNYHYLARINPDGTIDSSFSSIFPPSPIAVIYEIERQTDGKIVYAGNFGYVLRVNADGTPDGSFSVPVNNDVRALTVQPNDKILVGGFFTSIAGVPRFRIARLNANGSLDAAFDIPSGANNIVYDFSLQTDGKILVAGAFTKLGNTERIGAARLVQSATTQFDFDGDGRTDIGVWRASSGSWWYLHSSDLSGHGHSFGLPDDIITPGDFTGDGKTDVAIWRPSTGEWFVRRSEDGSYFSYQFGLTGDIPAPVDYDGDGITDTATFRPSTQTWYIFLSSNGTFGIVTFGLDGDKPVPADYDGDGKADIAVWRPGNGSWWIVNSSNLEQRGYGFGTGTDKPVPGDYTGDGKVDIAVWRDSTREWYFLRSEDGSYYSYPSGLPGDIPAPGDYDGDGKFDSAVFRPSTQTWYIDGSTAGSMIATFGLNGDRPVSNAFVP